MCVCNHTWRTSDCKFITRKSALVASLQSGVRLSRRQGSMSFFTNRISRVVACLTQFGSAVSLLTPKCLLGARHVAHEMQRSVLVARAVFVLRNWCASPSPSFRQTIVTWKGNGRSQQCGRMLSADHVFNVTLPSPVPSGFRYGHLGELRRGVRQVTRAGEGSVAC